jgi:hypothetical protein
MIDKLFLSVGAMKAGTTWLYDKLKQHPDIHFSPQKEVHFLSQYYGHTNILALPKRDKRARTAMRRLRAKEKDPKQVRRMRHWYADYKAEPVDYAWFEKIMEADHAEGRYIADFSNLNCFLTPDNWNDLKGNHVKQLRVIYIMRDPIKRIWSHFKYHLQFSKHPAANAPEKDFDLFREILGKDWFWRNACYAATCNTLRSGLEQDELQVMYFEDMVQSPEQFLRDVCRFIGLDPLEHEDDLSRRKNASIVAALPAAWDDYARRKLQDELSAMQTAGIWHPKWLQTS